MKKRHCTFVTVGIADNGKRIRKRIYYDNQSEYNFEYQKLMRQYDGLRNTELLTLGVYIDRFINAYASALAVTTQGFYKEYLGKFRPLYPVRLVNITKMDLQRIINENVEHPCTCKHMRTAISRVFNCAVDDGYISSNPAKNLSLPKRNQKERRAFTDSEIKAILSADYDSMQRLAVLLFFYFGLRPEELRALMPSDFDFKALTLTISRACVFNGNMPVLKGTKTDSVRVLPLPDAIIPVLRAYFADLRAPYLFHDKEYNLMSRGRFRAFYERIFRQIDASIGIDGYMSQQGLTLYNFRHTVGVRLYYSPNVSNKYSARFLGHSEDIFVKVYSHVDESREDIRAVYSEIEQ